MNDQQRATMQMALNLLEMDEKYPKRIRGSYPKEVITALREALYEPNSDNRMMEMPEALSQYDAPQTCEKHCERNAYKIEIRRLKKCLLEMQNAAISLAQPQGEPVAWLLPNGEPSIERFNDSDMPLYYAPPSVKAAMSELQHKYDELLEHYTWQGNQYMEAMRNKAAEIEAAIEATKEKAAKVCLETFEADSTLNWCQGVSKCAAAIRSMK